VRATRPYTYLGTVQGMCRQCRRVVPCRVLEDGGAVYQERLCPTCGPSRARLADDAAWYRRMMRTTVRCKPPQGEPLPVRAGCPHDCGPCGLHAGGCQLAVFSVTNVCQMACPICFTYNRPDRPYYMPREELRRLIDGVVARSAPLDLVNVTGGEPTMHPDIFDLLAECRRPEIGRVTMNSNGLRLAEDEAFCRALADLGVYVVLSLHTLRSDRSLAIHGRDVVAAKRRALENLQAAAVPTTLLHVMIRGVNDDEAGDVLALAREYPVVRSVNVQTMTYTGQGGGTFGLKDASDIPVTRVPLAACPPVRSPENTGGQAARGTRRMDAPDTPLDSRNHLPLDGAARAIESATGGQVRQEHFVPHPSAHPLCYQVAYYLKGGDRPRSFTEFLGPAELRDLLAGGYLAQASEAGERHLRTAIDRLWAEGNDPALLAQLKDLVAWLYPVGVNLTRFQRQRLAEEAVLTVYLHAHMDEDTLDLGRLVACPDQVPDAAGRMIPACAYNLFYRMNDERFWPAAAKANHGLSD
jgi:7,8-dihydro-6-hydroxymethylpterin dimethyltransferase